MSLVSPRKRNWATAQDWAVHRELITHLYWDERHTLKQVAEIMSQKHGFDATQKMYKTQFKKWNLVKNMKSHDANRVTQNTILAGRTEMPFVRGRPFGAKKLRDWMGQMVAMQRPLREIRSPDETRFSEDSILNVIQWTTSRTETNAFDFQGSDYPFSGDIGMRIWHTFSLSVRNSTPANPVVDFVLMNKVFSWYDGAFDVAEPSLLWTALCNILKASMLVGEELSSSMVRYFASLCSIKFGVHHPLSRLWCILQNVPIRQVLAATPAILEAYFDSLTSNNPVGELVRRVNLIHTVHWLVAKNLMTLETATTKMKAIIADLYLPGGYDNFSSDHYWWAQIAYAAMLHEGGRHLEADEVLMPAGRYMHQGYPEFSIDRIRRGCHAKSYYDHKARVMEALGRIDEATPHWVAAYEWSKLEGEIHMIANGGHALEKHYHKKGDLESAKSIQAEVATAREVFTREEITQYAERKKIQVPTKDNLIVAKSRQ